jgi:ketosteroid isomerase-like protein
MGEQENVQMVREIYAAFGRGDVPTILNLVAEDVEWTNPGAPAVPYAGRRRGRAQVAEFLAALNENVKIERLVLRDLIAQEGQVVALGSWQGRVRANDRMFETDWAMLWVCARGRVARFRCYQDTARMAAAFHADAATTTSTTIPIGEIESFLETVDEAIDLAHHGEAVTGFSLLLSGLQSAQRARSSGAAWGRVVIECYRLILLRFVDMYEVGHR